MTVTAPPRPPRPSDPVDREEVEALVEALIEEARQRAQRRRRRNAAVVTLVALVGVALFAVLGRSAQSQPAPDGLTARSASSTGPANSTIVFVRWPADRPPRSHLYAMNADGSNQRDLTQEWGVKGSPTWSPDGRRIAFTSGAGIFVRNADGIGLQRLTRNPVRGAVVWSPDGQRIAFMRSRRWERFEGAIWVMNADGSEVRRLTTEASLNGGLSWSPDGRKIAFVKPVGNGDIYVMNADGGGLRNLTHTSETEEAPAWSPDGRKIAFSRAIDVSIPNPWNGDEIYAMNADGSGQRNLTRDKAVDVLPAWSPGGRKIGFVSYRAGESAALYVMNSDGSGLRKLAGELAKDPFWDWSPYGREIVFSSVREGNPELYVIKTDGNEHRRLTNDPAWDVLPAWVPAPRS